MPNSTIIVVQGAGEGAYDEDAPLAEYVRGVVEDPASVAYPKIKGLEELDWSQAELELKSALNGLSEGGIVIAHSLGGAAILKLLSSGADHPRIDGLFLIATPYKCKDGEWGTDDFALENDFGARLPKIGTLHLYHGRDDDFVPLAHIERYAQKLPQAHVEVVDGQGHQFTEKSFTELKRDLATLNSVS